MNGNIPSKIAPTKYSNLFTVGNRTSHKDTITLQCTTPTGNILQGLSGRIKGNVLDVVYCNLFVNGSCNISGKSSGSPCPSAAITKKPIY